MDTTDNHALDAAGCKRKHEALPPLTRAAVDHALEFAGNATPTPAPDAVAVALDSYETLWNGDGVVRFENPPHLKAARAAHAALLAERDGLRAALDAADRIVRWHDGKDEGRFLADIVKAYRAARAKVQL